METVCNKLHFHFIAQNKIHKILKEEQVFVDDGTALFIGDTRSLYFFVVGNHMLWLDRWRSARLFRSGVCFGNEYVLLEEALLDELV